MLVALYPIFSPQSKNVGPPVQTAAPGSAAAGSASNVDLTTMTPREAADRLWDRIQRAVEAGDTQEVISFLPMAIGAYEVAKPLDQDGKYHLSTLMMQALDNEGALEVAEAGLAENPDHLMNLAAAADAALALGDSASARTFYQRMMDAWDGEIAANRPEYLAHTNLQPILRQKAEALLGG